jgi:hypothetical protein
MMMMMVVVVVVLQRMFHPFCSPSLALYRYGDGIMMIWPELRAQHRGSGFSLAIRVIPFPIHVRHQLVTGELVWLWLRQFQRMAWLVLRMLLPQPRA